MNTTGRDFYVRVSPRWPADGSLVYFSRCLDSNCDDHDIYQATWRLSSPPPPSFRRGDADGSGRMDLSDAVGLLNYLFLGAPAPACQDAADADDDGRLNITDVVYSLGYQFLGSPPPSAPGPDACGSDPTPDALPDCGYDASKC
jgi:hypothetical protein